MTEDDKLEGLLLALTSPVVLVLLILGVTVTVPRLLLEAVGMALMAPVKRWEDGARRWSRKLKR